MPKKKILVIDDEEGFVTDAKSRLEKLGKYQVMIETSGAQALSTVRKFKPDLILLDLLMPEVSGFQICKSLKAEERFSSMPIVILSARETEFDKVTALDIGADDYMVKPFSINELDARIRAVLRRAKGGDEEKEIVVGDTIVINLPKYQVEVKGEAVELTPTEFSILKLLASKKGRVFTRSSIMDYLWDMPYTTLERTIDVHIKHLREKLGKAGSFVKNVRGIGYKIDEN